MFQVLGSSCCLCIVNSVISHYTSIRLVLFIIAKPYVLPPLLLEHQRIWVTSFELGGNHFCLHSFIVVVRVDKKPLLMLFLSPLSTSQWVLSCSCYSMMILQKVLVVIPSFSIVYVVSFLSYHRNYCFWRVMFSLPLSLKRQLAIVLFIHHLFLCHQPIWLLSFNHS